MESQIQSFKEKLITAGWQETTSNPFREKVSQGADLYFTFTAQNGQNLGICIFEPQKILKFRLANAQNQDCRWFQSEYADKLAELTQSIINQQDTVNLNNYFDIYFALSGICSTSILAWEQWESNYR